MTQPARIALIALALFAVALALRLHRLDAKCLWMDESAEIVAAQTPPQFLRYAARVHAAYMPLQCLMDHIVTRHTNSDFLWRLPEALLGSLSVVLVFLFVVEARRRKEEAGTLAVAFAAALLVAANPLHLALSQEVRQYAMSHFFACLSLWVYAQYLNLWAGAERQKFPVGLTIVNALGLLAFVYQGMAMLAQAAHVCVVALLNREFSQRRRLVALLAASLAASSVPLLIWMQYAITGGFAGNAPAEPFWRVVWSAFVELAGGNAGIAVIAAVLVAIGVAASMLRRVAGVLPERQSKEQRNSPLLLGTHTMGVVVLLLPLLALPIILDFSRPYFYHPRQVLNALPAVAVLTAVGLSELLRFAGRWRSTLVSTGAIVAAVCAGVSPGWYETHSAHKPERVREWMAGHAQTPGPVLVVNCHGYTYRTISLYTARYFGARATLIDPDERHIANPAPQPTFHTPELNLYENMRRNAAARSVLLFFDFFEHPNPDPAMIDSIRKLPLVADVLAERNMVGVLIRAPEGGPPFDFLPAILRVNAAIPYHIERHVKINLLRAQLAERPSRDELDQLAARALAE